MLASSVQSVPRLGPYGLRQMLGKSSLTKTSLGARAGAQFEMTLCMPWSPMPPEHLAAWWQRLQMCARLQHPRLLAALEVGEHEGLPFAVYERRGYVTLGERLLQGNASPLEVAQWICQALEGLAYLHEAGQAHLDVGLHTIVLDAQDQVALLGAGVAAWPPGQAPQPQAPGWPAAQQDQAALELIQANRQAAQRDLLMLGLVMHRLLAGHPALDDPDVAGVAERVGREIARLPWTTPQPVPDALRAIVNRATDRQARQRYLSARSWLRALRGWLELSAQGQSGPLGLILERLQTVGHLPARPGLNQQIQRLTRMEGERLDAMVDQIVQDPALVCELLRHVNSARFIGHGETRTSSVRRAMLLIGLGGVQTMAASLRAWPGALPEGADGSAARNLDAAMRRACRVGLVAEILCPSDTEAQEALLAGMLQHLGRLLVLYHLPDEAAQIQKLTWPVPATQHEDHASPGMSEPAAAHAVLGIDLDALGIAVARHWGFEDGLIHAMHPYGAGTVVRAPDDREDRLRAWASLANEAVAASQLPTTKQAPAFTHLAQRYGRALNVSVAEIQDALAQAARLQQRHAPPS